MGINGIGQRLNEILEVKDLKIRGFSEATGIPYRSAQNYLSGKQVPGAEALAKIHTRLGIDLNWLVCGTGNMFGIPRQLMAGEEPGQYGDQWETALGRLKSATRIVEKACEEEAVNPQTIYVSDLVDIVYRYGIDVQGVRRLVRMLAHGK